LLRHHHYKESRALMIRVGRLSCAASRQIRPIAARGIAAGTIRHCGSLAIAIFGVAPVRPIAGLLARLSSRLLKQVELA
jgi:hypothetical protein